MSHERIFKAEDIEEYEEEEKLYCPYCIKLGLYIILGHKILLPNEEKQPDYDNWLQCSKCARVIPIYEAPKEETIKDSVSTIENPFDEQKGQIIGVNKDSKTKRKKKFQPKPHKDKELNELICRHGEENVKIHYDSSR